MSDGDRRLADAEWKGEVKAMLKEIRMDIAEIRDALKKQNGRIGSLENSRSFAIGAGSILGGIAGWITSHMGGSK